MFTIPYTIRQEILVNASPKDIWKNIVSFERMQIWSPWLVLDPHTQVTVRGTDQTIDCEYSWKSHLLGEGMQRHTHIDEEKKVEGQMLFQAPFQAIYQISMSLEPVGDQTRVIWWMQGRAPFYLFFMKWMVTPYISRDFHRGLVMLKELCETGKIETASVYEGEAQREAFAYIGIKRSSTLEALPELMQKDFAMVVDFAKNNNLSLGQGIALYTSQTNPYKNTYEFISGFQFSKDQFEKISTQGEIIKGLYPTTKTLTITHHGAYRFLGNSWTLAYARITTDRKVMQKGMPAYELYISDPSKVPEDELESEVHVPLYG